jgi:hypothetical protein
VFPLPLRPPLAHAPTLRCKIEPDVVVEGNQNRTRTFSACLMFPWPRLYASGAFLFARKLRQLRNVHRNPSRLVFGE